MTSFVSLMRRLNCLAKVRRKLAPFAFVEGLFSDSSVKVKHMPIVTLCVELQLDHVDALQKVPKFNNQKVAKIRLCLY